MYELFDVSGWVYFVIHLFDWVPAFEPEPIARAMHLIFGAAFKIVPFMVICWLISWIPPLENSKILTLCVGLFGIVFSAYINIIIGRMTDIEFMWGSIALIGSLSVGLFLPRDRITRLMTITVAGGLGLPLLWIIVLASCQAMQLNDLVSWGFVALFTVTTVRALIPQSGVRWIEKRVKLAFDSLLSTIRA